MKLSLIVAVARGNVIGRDGKLPWRLSADLQRFKKLTMGHHILAGRKTYESIGRLLPGRKMIIITRQCDYEVDGAQVVSSLPAALEAALGDDEVFVIGGAEIYSLALPIVDRIYKTTVEAEIQGDTFFPAVDLSNWQVVSDVRAPADDKNEFAHCFQVLDRVHRSAAETVVDTNR